MSTIRTRPEFDLAVRPGVTPTEAGGYTSGAENSLMEPGTADVSALRVAPTTQTESAIGAFRETIAAKALRGADYLSIPSEDGFDVTASLGGRASQYSAEELEFLSDARSTTELAQRMGQVTQTRENLADMGANPVTALAASLLDVDAVIGLGVGKAVGVARSARLIAGLTANSAVLGLASEGGDITALDIIGTSLGVALGAVPKVQRAAAVAEDLTEDTIRVVDDLPPRTPPAQATAAELAETDTSIVLPPKMESVPDPDYIPPTPDTVTVRPYLEVNRGTGTTMRMSTQNFVGAIMAHSDDLPEGVRILGASLAESLARDADVPLILRAETKSSRSNVRLASDGSLRTAIYVNGGVQDNLTNTVRGMSAYDRSIALHEAAHAKTVRVLHDFERSVLTDPQALAAATRINSIRETVRAAWAGMDKAGMGKGAKYNVDYGLKNNDEFISQLFNSEDFRKVLQDTKIDANTSIWTDLVRRVVQAFTGKAPTDTAFEHTVAAFEELLRLPNNPNIGTRPAAPVPIMQSPMLQGARTPAELATKAGNVLNRNFSLYDRIKSFGTEAGRLADALVIDATGSTATSATHYARTAELAANVAAAQVDTAIRQVMSQQGWGAFSRIRNPVRYLDAQRTLSEKVYAKLADNHARYRAGEQILPHDDANIEKIIKSFADSRWAEDQLDRIKTAGVQGAEMVESSPYYLPRRHSGDKVSQFLRDNPNVTRADVEGMYASQFSRMFSEQGMLPETAKSLGKQMLRNMEQRAAGVSGYRQHIAGMSNDDIEFAMRNAGIEEDQISAFLRSAEAAGKDSNTVRNLRRRAEFNMTEDFVTKSGQLIHPELFVDKDVLKLMEGYSRNMSGRVGLARAGFPDVKSLAAAIDNASATATDARAARDVLDNTANQLLGYPTGEDVPDILRSFSIASGAVQLANSGIYQLADAALMVKEFGITKVLRGMTKTAWGRDGLALAQSAEYGSRLRDILEARNVLSGRYRSVLTHLDDNTDIGHLGVAHQTIQQLGQGTRFVNGMEYVRRGQSKLMAGLVADSFDAAIRGDAEAIKSLGRFGLSADLLEQARAAMKANPDLREWPSGLRLDIETAAHNMADSLVLENRLGEIPAWMQFSSLGKFILPYMNFVAGTWNKILRRTYTQEGAKGVAMMFAYQLPLTTLSSTVALAQANKDITPGALTANVMTQLPLMSWMGYAVNMLTQGPTNSIAALGLIDKAYSATSSIISGDPDMSQIVRAVPFLGILPGMRIAAAAFEEDDE